MLWFAHQLDSFGNLRIVHRPLPENDPRQHRPDISRAQELLSWAPTTPLKEGLSRTIAYFEQLLMQNGVKESLAERA
jgi:UDP-glucuronate decarboxylase